MSVEPLLNGIREIEPFQTEKLRHFSHCLRSTLWRQQILRPDHLEITSFLKRRPVNQLLRTADHHIAVQVTFLAAASSSTPTARPIR